MALSIFVLAWAVTAGAVGGQSPPIRVRDGLVPVVPAVPSDVRIALLEERLASDPRHYDSRWQAAA
ncbi:MAG TPA: hypothetical protein VLA09_04170, partial [Longimicrobiales bacterium]|nr:hypothetical protein [Longimicrobiales bacterium]